jgi:hypothetical protein
MTKSAGMLLICATTALSAARATAQSPAVEAWRQLARADAEAALRLIEENHPAAAPSLGDTIFQRYLRTARANVETRLPQVGDYDGYTALMSGLAAEFRDGHIWSTARVQKQRRGWAGILLGRQAGQWIVTEHETVEDEASLVGARVVACDDVDVDAWSRERIGRFRGDPTIGSTLAASAPWLLLDDGNPFLDRPTSCTFVPRDGVERRVVLRWRGVGVRELETALSRAYQRPRAGMGVQQFAGGWWISLETLGPSAAAVVSDVERHAAALQNSPVVVLDLRGNGGGNSAYANAIAAALFGREALASLAGSFAAAECSGAFWRASANNRAAIAAYRDAAERRGDAGSIAQLDALLRGFDEALAAGDAFTPTLPACAPTAQPMPEPTPVSFPDSPMTARLVVVTDRHCFSSCLIAVAIFRALGATQVGEATDVSTRYMEVREIVLPSGLRTFSTLQKVSIGVGDFGPYDPHVLFPGSLADTDALKEWVARQR